MNASDRVRLRRFIEGIIREDKDLDRLVAVLTKRFSDVHMDRFRSDPKRFGDRTEQEWFEHVDDATDKLEDALHDLNARLTGEGES